MNEDMMNIAQTADMPEENGLNNAVPPMTFKAKFSKWWNNTGLGWAFMLPFIILFCLFVALPIVLSLRYCFTYYNMVQPAQFNGLENFRYMIMDDDVFRIALGNTLKLAVVIGPVGYIASFFFAWVINNLKYRTFFVLAFYTPSIVSSVAMAVVWKVVFASDRYGYINSWLLQAGIIDEPLLFTQDPGLIITVVIIVSLWMSLGMQFLVFIAGLQNMPTDLYEVAYIDGMSNVFQELWYITFPMMKPQLLFGAISAITSAFQVGTICTDIAGFPSPDYCAQTLVLHMEDYTFYRYELGYASAVAIVLFAITFTLGRIFMKVLSTKGEY